VRILLSLLLLPACIEQIGPGPDLGQCAQPPDRIHTFGEVGIGTCLAGPADLHFFEQEGTTWLAVANANPFLNFETGSVLLIDWDSVDFDTPENHIDELDAHALAMDNYVGGVGYVADPFKQVLLVSGRLSEGSRTRSHNDELWVVDVADPAEPVPWALGDHLTLKDDPQPIVVHPEFDRAYVGNITDHSVSVLDTSGAPIESIDVAPRVTLGGDRFYDSDWSGSRAEADLSVLIGEDVPNERWTLSWLDASHRIWVPEQGGLRRWNYGGLDYSTGNSGVELDPEDSGGLITGVSDPFYAIQLGAPQMLFGNRGHIWGVEHFSASVWDWSRLIPYVVSGEEGEWDGWLDAPSVLTTPDADLVFYDARSEEGAPASIGVALLAEGVSARLLEPVLEPEGDWVSFEDPFVRNDALAQLSRMWLSIWDGEHWSIGLAETADGLEWPAPVEVLAADDMDVAAPAVTYVNGRYRMWAALGDGEQWQIAEAWSRDGMEWSDLTPVVPLADPYDPTRPPRVALQNDSAGGFRVEGDTLGEQSGIAIAGSTYLAGLNGFTIRVSNSFEISPRDLDDTAVNGVIPVSSATSGDTPRLYVTTIDGSDRRGMAVLERPDGRWIALAEDLVPPGMGGNDAGVESPVVLESGGLWHMYYGAWGADGSVRLHRATSADGVSWEPSTISTPTRDTWENLARIPHSWEPLDDGGIRVWYAATDGTQSRIGAMVSTDLETFTADPGLDNPWHLGPGAAGEFDDSGVRDPAVYRDGDTTHLWYSGYDGDSWAIGHATRAVEDPEWRRSKHPVTGENQPNLFGVSRTFSAHGALSPVLLVDGGGDDPVSVEALYAGFDGAKYRVGAATGDLTRLFPTFTFPTAGDRLVFSTFRGDSTGGVVELEQNIDGFYVSGQGTSQIRLDEARGFLYVAAKRTNRPSNFIYVVDVRDDSVTGYQDSNYLDIESILQVSQTIYSSGFRDVVAVPGTDRLYATGHVPEGVTVFDLSSLVDDAQKDVIPDAAVASLPLLRVSSRTPIRPYQDEDAGADTLARFNGAGMALSPSSDLLFVTSFRENALVVYDLELGPWGEEIRRITGLGENPHLVRLTPDGRYAVVANYLGDVEDGVVHSTLAVVDIDPTSDTFLDVVTRIKNR
jgi:DNA-binding beta-propeller fold protein YncE